MIGTKQLDWETSGPGESGRADRILAAGFEQPAGEAVLIESPTLVVTDPAFDAAVRATVDALVFLDPVTKIRSPLTADNAGQVSADGHAALVTFQIRGPADDAGDQIDPILDRIAEVKAAHPEVFVGQFGDVSADQALTETFGGDLKKAGLFSIPVTLAILVVAFGALVAAGIPLLLALTAVAATMGLIALPSQLMPVDESIHAVVLLIGLAVGVDYTLFYLKREREERAAGRSAEAALEAAAATSGRSVLVSGLTVMVAMAGMFFTGNAFASFGLATMIVVAVAMVGSLTVLPAVLSKLGDNVDRLRVPLVHRLRRTDGEGRIWGAIVDRVLKRPVLSVVVAGGLLVALALPALQLRIAEAGVDSFPQDLPVMQTFNRLQAAFPGTEIPANVVVQAPNVDAPVVRAAIGELRQRALATGVMHEPIEVDVNEDGTVANVAIPINGAGTDAASGAALTALRSEIVPETVGALEGAESAVTGMTARSRDNSDRLKAAAPLVFAFVLVFAFGLLLVAFRSLAIASKAILLNLLSVAAAYGVLVLVFQHGVGKGLIGFESTGGIVPWLPIFLFVILFGLSMDYHVFILSRVRECYDRGSTTEEAIAHGIKTTAGVVTSAAIVMVGVFSIFAVLSIVDFKQMGVGLAAAILIDATIVRAVLLPATMKLLGEANWYLPKWLEWLPRLEHEREVEADEPVAAAPALDPVA
jgi:RND superfamily putative drug exporter